MNIYSMILYNTDVLYVYLYMCVRIYTSSVLCTIYNIRYQYNYTVASTTIAIYCEL